MLAQAAWSPLAIQQQTAQPHVRECCQDVNTAGTATSCVSRLGFIRWLQYSGGRGCQIQCRVCTAARCTLTDCDGMLSDERRLLTCAAASILAFCRAAIRMDSLLTPMWQCCRWNACAAKLARSDILSGLRHNHEAIVCAKFPRQRFASHQQVQPGYAKHIWHVIGLQPLSCVLPTMPASKKSN
jgi:hypothetical protein